MLGAQWALCFGLAELSVPVALQIPMHHIGTIKALRAASFPPRLCTASSPHGTSSVSSRATSAMPSVMGPRYASNKEAYMSQVRIMTAESQRICHISNTHGTAAESTASVARRLTRIAYLFNWAKACVDDRKRKQAARGCLKRPVPSATRFECPPECATHILEPHKQHSEARDQHDVSFEVANARDLMSLLEAGVERSCSVGHLRAFA